MEGPFYLRYKLIFYFLRDDYFITKLPNRDRKIGL